MTKFFVGLVSFSFYCSFGAFWAFDFSGKGFRVFGVGPLFRGNTETVLPNV